MIQVYNPSPKKKSYQKKGYDPLSVDVVRGSEINTEEIRKMMREYWPAVKNWREIIGIPLVWFRNFGVIYQIAGRDKVGKSHLSSIIAAAHSKHDDVIYITTEFPAPLVHQKMLSLGADPDHIVYIDFSKNPVGALGEAKTTYTTPFVQTAFFKKFMEAYETVSGKPVLVVIDSMTSFYESQEFSARALAANIVRTVRYVKDVLTIGISQKRTAHGESTTEVAGGLGVSHLMDGTFVLYRYHVTPFKRVSDYLYTLAQAYGNKLTFLSWDGNRWGPTPPDDYLIRFTETEAEIVVPVGSRGELPEGLK